MKKPAHKGARRLRAEPGLQYAALPYRDADGLEILLVTSRETRRWVIPKGWPIKGRKPPASAAREALEEAGVVGRVAKKALGAYSYIKRLKNGAPLACTVEVFPLKVARQRKRWREQHQRTVHWFTLEEAVDAVHEPELQALIEAFGQALAATRRSPAPTSEAALEQIP